jgi:hypothetical protein
MLQLTLEACEVVQENLCINTKGAAIYGVIFYKYSGYLQHQLMLSMI